VSFLCVWNMHITLNVSNEIENALSECPVATIRCSMQYSLTNLELIDVDGRGVVGCRIVRTHSLLVVQ
jgi:hypothetical protein